MNHPHMFTLTLPELSDQKEKARLCWAFLSAEGLWHQEIAVFNPECKEFDSVHVFPRDIFLFVFHVESGQSFPTFEEIYEIIRKKKAPVICTGSHKEIVDRTFQILLVPDDPTYDSVPLVVKCVDNQGKKDKAAIKNALVRAYLRAKNAS